MPYVLRRRRSGNRTSWFPRLLDGHTTPVENRIQMLPRLRSVVLFTAAASTPYLATETDLGRQAIGN